MSFTQDAFYWQDVRNERGGASGLVGLTSMEDQQDAETWKKDDWPWRPMEDYVGKRKDD